VRVVTCHARASQGASSELTPCLRGAGVCERSEQTHADLPPEVAWRAVATLFYAVAPALDRVGRHDSERVCLMARERVMRACALLRSEAVLAGTGFHTSAAAPLARRAPRRAFRFKRPSRG
jgi:hypothetical protein